jgi:hypothetical protein
MNQHATHHLNHTGTATLDEGLDREQIVSLKTKLQEAGLPEAPSGGSLVERLDPALVEASSGMGTLLTELIRRTLRGGVQRIDDELQSQVEEKVDATVAERIPVIESTAEVKARQVAEQEVKHTAHRLDGQLAQTRLELASTKDTLAETKTLLAAAQRRLTETQHDLSQQIAASGHRAEKTARDLVREQVENLSRRSKNTLESLYNRFDSLELQLGHLESQLTRMAARVIELERPRGLGRLWQLLRGRRKVAKK